MCCDMRVIALLRGRKRLLNYAKYISSEAWRRCPARLAELEAAGHRCRICFQEGTSHSPLEVHHATYRRLGQEEVGDLLALCGPCHREVTTFLRRRRYHRRPPLRADVLRMRDTRCALVDPTRKEMIRES
jgi:hypothetical protein